MSSEVLTVRGDQSVEELRRELADSREQQAATAEILRVISSSPTDLQRVFAEIATSAARLCGTYDAVIRQVEGEVLRLVAHHGPVPTPSTIPVSRNSVVGCAVIDRRTIHVADLQSEADEYPESRNRALQLGHRTALGVPLVHAGEAVGVILIRRTDVHPFTDRQIDLLKTFADQAVIAIGNTRLFEDVQARTKELQESLEYQSAIGDVLAVISRSPSNVQPVLDMIAVTAMRLCQSDRATIWRLEDRSHRLVAMAPSDETLKHRLGETIIPVDRSSVSGRVALDGRTVHVHDAWEDSVNLAVPELVRDTRRTIVGVPLLSKGAVAGVIILPRSKVQPFTGRQIALVETFAEQAVIAIENARLFEAEQASKRELQESLEQQTATSEVLGVISSSPGELNPVFQAMMANATRLCEAKFGVMWLRDQGGFRAVALHNAPQEFADERARHPMVYPPKDTGLARLVDTKMVNQIADIRAIQSYIERDPFVVASAELGGYRTVLNVPMLRDYDLVGAMSIYRQEVRPFNDKQVQLVNNFAKQAVIAIENTRLLNEVRESLQQQTATADVLKAISHSTFNLPKVLDTLVESAARLCDAFDALILQADGDVLRPVGHYGSIPTPGPLPLVGGTVMARAVIERRTIQVADLQTAVEEYPVGSDFAIRAGFRTQLVVPLTRGAEAIGVIAIRRSEVRAFTERQIELLQTFADQAVIAIENTRLFEEVQARTHELARTVEDLEIQSQHKSQFVANMSHELRTPLAAILGYAELMQEGFYEPQGPKSLDALTRIRSNGKHLLGLINTVLDIAKIESGQFTLNMVEYALESVVETVRSATESLAQNKKLALKTEVAKSLPIGLGDEQRLTQVLLNLVGNAIKFTDSGEVRVTAKFVNGHFAVSVTDTGPGIPEEHQARIFDQFHQVDSSNTKAKGGTGLGLAIAKQIVEMHGGRIWVESTLGQGSTFQMQLPTRAQFRNSAP
jgi:signal transduction histidine kinase